MINDKRKNDMKKTKMKEPRYLWSSLFPYVHGTKIMIINYLLLILVSKYKNSLDFQPYILCTHILDVHVHQISPNIK